MEKNKKISRKSNTEPKFLLILSAFFITLMMSAWMFSLNLRDRIVAKNSSAAVQVSALVDVEQIRNSVESETANSLAFFLLGSSNLFDQQKNEKLNLTENLARFEKQYSSPQIKALVARIGTFRQQAQDIFDQGMEYRAKQTESKIVGQFYRAKTTPLLTNINKALDEILILHTADFNKAQSTAEATSKDIESSIPDAMIWFTALITVLFSGMILLVLRLLNQRTHQITERDRLFQSAQNAALIRDGILSAVSQDFNEPLSAITQATAGLKGLNSNADVIQSNVVVIEDRIKDILDQTKADMGNMHVRVEQIAVDSILDEAQLWLEPMAKEKDIRLEFTPANPPVLAFIDRERVLRVLSNLIGNALKFSPRHSKVTVKVRSDQQFAYVSIKDSGPGIPEKQLSDIFTRFWQDPKTAEQGAGVGLSIAKKIIDAHGGTLTVESHLKHGSTFTFSVPRRRPAAALLKKPAQPTIKTQPRVYTQAPEKQI